MINFFSKPDEARIIATIREAEKATSGEIRVHLERKYKGDITEAAHGVFHALRMDRTELRNGVLIFIVPSMHAFAIYGDEGINRKVPPHFWEDVRDIMQQHFREGQFAEGVCQGVRLAGEKLSEFFPRTTGDVNELPDDISFGN
ncbi:MAG: hypothetical protein RI973_789 [Bacteroidota bacterium]|jgi:uncharacterized membrane protein